MTPTRILMWLMVYLIAITPIGGLVLAIVKSDPDIFYISMTSVAVILFLSWVNGLWD